MAQIRTRMAQLIPKAAKKRLDEIRETESHSFTQKKRKIFRTFLLSVARAVVIKQDIDGIIVDVGLLPNNESVKDLVTMNEKGEVVVDCACRTSVEGFFGAGDVTTVPHKQIIIAGGEGAKAALSAYDYLMEKSLI